MAGRISFFDIANGELSRVPVPKIKHTLPKKPGNTGYVSLGSIIGYLLNQTIHAYTHNRGTGTVSKNTSTRVVRDGVNFDVIGEIPFGMTEDGVLALADCHSRLHGVLTLYRDNRLTDTELNSLVSVRYVIRHLEAYIDANSQDPHKLKDIMQNPTLTYGHLVVNRIFGGLPPQCIAAIGDNKWTTLMSVCYAMIHHDRSDPKEWNFRSVYGCRTPAKDLANRNASDNYLKLSDAQVQEIVKSIKSWHQLHGAITKCSQVSGVCVKKFLSSSGFFGYYIVHRLRKPNVLPNDTDSLAKIVMKNILKLTNDCSVLSHCGQDLIDARCDDWDRLLTKAPRKVRNSKRTDSRPSPVCDPT